MDKTTAIHMSWMYDGNVNLEGLEQFATSIAVLARFESTPLAVLENVLGIIAENLNAARGLNVYDAEAVLSERAAALGFEDMSYFRKELVRLIGERMIDLKTSELMALQQHIRSKKQVAF